MKLVIDLGTVRDKQGKLHRKGMFECGHCGGVVERWFYAGNRDQSCGCARREIAGQNNTKHGHYRARRSHPLAVVWGGMKARCYSANHAMSRHYGARGIRVCDEWLNNVDAFITWSISNGWSRGLQLDRVDNDGDYSPSNCRYVSGSANVRNSSATKLTADLVVEIRREYAAGGTSHAKLSCLYGVCKSTIRRIVVRKLWADIGD
jgi:hypothetical protein